MATATVKSLHRTGRLSRKKVRAVIAKVRADLEKKPAPRKVAKIRMSDTASGRGDITFRFARASDAKRKSAVTARRAVRKSR